ncbi:hypothetical protein G9A89_016256 [Geosiphon pyriformis]|nr:hypothetical protein G9A89_016256 [Geosiphon pyriformis]
MKTPLRAALGKGALQLSTKIILLLICTFIPRIFAQPGLTIPLSDGKVEYGNITAGVNSSRTFYFPLLSDKTGGLKSLFARATPGKGSIPKQSSASIDAVSQSSLTFKASTTSSASIEKNIQQKENKVLYISLTTCSSPSWASELLQLVFYVSHNEFPGPNHGSKVILDEGYGFLNFSIQDDQTGVYISIYAPNEPKGDFTFELGASLQGYLNIYNDTSIFYLDDTDNNTALVTAIEAADNMQNYTAYIVPKNGTQGLSNSKCAVNKIFSKLGFTSTTVRHPSNTIGQLLYFSNLQNATEYMIYPALTQGRVTTMWKPIRAKTKISNNCRLLYNLEFCNKVAYAVPANNSHTYEEIVESYNKIVQPLWGNFTTTLNQFDCNTTYSLVRNCGDCKEDYNNWLCAVTMPRCTDVNGVDEGRLVALNSSRVHDIDKILKPGPYKEVLPCIDLCYRVVQSCPPFLNFNCPLKQMTLNASYAEMKSGNKAKNETASFCNSMGLEWEKISSAYRMILTVNIWLFGSWVWTIGVVGIGHFFF